MNALTPRLVLILILLLAAHGQARAQIPVLDSGPVALDLTGYVRSLTAVHDAGFDLPSVDRRTGLNAEVVRLKWQARHGERVVLDVHNRLQLDVSTAQTAFGESVAGFGVSAVPGRTIELDARLIEEEGLHLWHDVDRLALTVYTEIADVTVGRQAITWGISSLFPVADLWARFSPFELDTEEKPGIDAVRALSYPGEGLELDVVVADRGRRDDWSAGARLTAQLRSADVWGGVGKFWNEILAMAGAGWLFDQTKVRAEAVLPWNLDGDTLDLPRMTVGADWLSAKVSLSGEYHFNGVGVEDASAYAARLADPQFARGESYYLGRHYVGGLVSWAVDRQERVRVSGTVLVNLTDPSAALTPVVSYDVGQNTSMSIGTLQTLGQRPLVAVPPRIRSEYGTYGTLWFTRLSVYF